MPRGYFRVIDRRGRVRLADYYSETKEHLKNYKLYVNSLEQKKKRLSKLFGEHAPSGISNMAVNYGNERVAASHTFDFTDELASEILKIRVQISMLENLLEDIHKGFEQLDPLSMRIIQMKYINCWNEYYTWPRLALTLNLEFEKNRKGEEVIDYIAESTCRGRATKAICQIAISIFGIIKPIKKVS